MSLFGLVALTGVVVGRGLAGDVDRLEVHPLRTVIDTNLPSFATRRPTKPVSWGEEAATLFPSVSLRPYNFFTQNPALTIRAGR